MPACSESWSSSALLENSCRLQPLLYSADCIRNSPLATARVPIYSACMHKEGAHARSELTCNMLQEQPNLGLRPMARPLQRFRIASEHVRVVLPQIQFVALNMFASTTAVALLF